MASEKDKRIFRLIGEALNQPPVKMTEEEKLNSFDMKAYLEWLSEMGTAFTQMKGKLSATQDNMPEVIHQRAKALGMIHYPKK